MVVRTIATGEYLQTFLITGTGDEELVFSNLD